jgi:hypothetical protein
MRLLRVCIGLAALCLMLASSAPAQPPPGAFDTPFTIFRGHSDGLKVYLDLVEERVSFDAHARLSCANGSEHRQLLVEGGIGGRVDSGGRFHHTEHVPAEAGEQPPSTDRVTVEDVEESIVYGTPALFMEIKGRVLSNSVVGRIRFWEGPQRTPGSLHAKCGTGSPQGRWVRFVARRVKGPAQPQGHWPPERSAADFREPAPTHLPQVFCQAPPAPVSGEPATGFYRVRPRGCRFHPLGLGADYLSDLVFRIDWRRWTAESARGIGRFVVRGTNFKTGKHFKTSAPEVVRLSRPQTICGHLVFTRLEVRVYLDGRLVDDFDSDLDRVGETEAGCPGVG